ncbi:MAG: hypothetical protein K0V04_00980 [Deltaproteobacteria bacterium]|nr:hypothetical protein [Deltaproteobacteria bacterium]
MTEGLPSPQERLESILAEVDVTPTQMRRDPSGRTWLPESGRALVEAHPECGDALREYVDEELSLWTALERPGAAPMGDAFFTARVVEALPEPNAATRLSPRRRLALLGLFHIVGVMLAMMVLMMVPESTAQWASSAHDVLSWGSEFGAGMWVIASAVGTALLLVVVGSRTHTPA